MSKKHLWRRSFAKSATVRFICAPGLVDAAKEHAPLTRLRRACLIAHERSALLGLSRRFGHFLLRSSLSTYGTFFLLFSLFCILGRLIVGRFSFFELWFPTCLVLLVASIFLLHAKQSLSHAIGNSFLGRWLLFSVCRMPQDRFVFGEERGEERRWWTLFAALTLGVIGIWISPVLLFLFPLVLLCVALLQAVPELLWLAFLCLLPFLNLLVHTTAVLFIAVLAGELLWIGKVACGHRERHGGIVSRLVFLFGILPFLSGLFGLGGISTLLRGVVASVLVLSYFPLESFFSKPLWRRRAWIGIAFSAMITSILGILQYFFGDLELRWVDVARFSDIGGRVTSLFSNPNVLAVYLLLLFPLSLSGMLQKQEETKLRFFFGLSAASELLCILLTWSRGAWLGCLFALVMLLLLHGKTSRRILGWSLLPIGIWLPFLPHNIVNRFSSIATVRESSIQYRIYTWQGVCRMLARHPFGIGVGEEAFFALYRNFAVSGTETVPHTHNLLLQIAVELGMGGILCFGAVLVTFFGAVLGFLYKNGKSASACSVIGGFCAILGALVMGFFDWIWYHYGLLWLFWTVLAATVGMMRDLQDNDLERSFFSYL